MVDARRPFDQLRLSSTDLLNALGAEFVDGAADEGATYGFVAAIYVAAWATSNEEKE